MDNTLGRFLTLTLFLLICSISAYAQDPVFSQYTAAPVHSNPALVGLFEGEVRLTANYRDQWSSVLGGEPLRTYAAAGELRYNLGGRDYFAIAADALQDAGGASKFTVTRGGLGIALQKYLTGGRGRDATYLGFGARVGYGQHSVDPNSLWFSSEFDSVSVSVTPDGSGLQSGFLAQTRGYLDVGGGLNLAVVRRSYSIYAGISAHHLNSPNVSFMFNSATQLDPRYSAMLGGEYLIDDDLRVMPSALINIQGGSRQITTGAALYYRPDHNGDASFRTGLYARMANSLQQGMYFESLIVAGQLEVKRLTVGLSYDINTSALGRTTDGRGAYELSFSWTRAGKSRYKVVCPKM